MRANIITLFTALIAVVGAVPAHSAQQAISDAVYCVAAQVKPLEVLPASELAHHLLVTLFNSCAKDITAVTLDVKSIWENTAHAYRVEVDRLPQLVVRDDPDSPEQHTPAVDLLRVGKYIEITTPEPQPVHDSFEGSIKVVAVMFIDGSGLGDAGALSALIESRKTVLRAHTSQLQALALLSDKSRAAIMLSRPSDEIDKTTRDALIALKREGLLWNALNNSDQTAWARIVANKAHGLQRMVELYQQHITKAEQFGK